MLSHAHELTLDIKEPKTPIFVAHFGILDIRKRYCIIMCGDACIVYIYYISSYS